jgi:SRSO17 transposase
MTVQQIRALGPALARYLDEFADCFLSPDTRYHLKEYVSGQLSDLQRKSVQPIARLMDVPPRTLQEFLSLAEWDHDRLRDTLQHIVVRDHGEVQAIGIVDESGYPKKGKKTACVQRQYC